MTKTKKQVIKKEKENKNDNFKKVIGADELKKILKRLKIQNTMGKLLQTHQLKLAKKQVARFLTKKNNKKETKTT